METKRISDFGGILFVIGIVLGIIGTSILFNLVDNPTNCPDCICNLKCENKPLDTSDNVFFEFDHDAIRIFNPLGNLITPEDNSMRMGRGEMQVLSFRLNYINPVLENKTILCIEYGNNLNEVKLDTLPRIVPPIKTALSEVGNGLECYELPGIENYGVYELLLFIKQDYVETKPSTIWFHFLEEGK